MITINMDKAKVIAHVKRRRKRDADYLTVDGGTMYATLNPIGQGKRDAIKVKDDKLQLDIDSTTDAITLKQMLVDGDVIKT